MRTGTSLSSEAVGEGRCADAPYLGGQAGSNWRMGRSEALTSRSNAQRLGGGWLADDLGAGHPGRQVLGDSFDSAAAGLGQADYSTAPLDHARAWGVLAGGWRAGCPCGSLPEIPRWPVGTHG